MVEKENNRSSWLLNVGKRLTLKCCLKDAASSKPKVTCDICKKEFLNNQGLGCHKLKCEKENGMSSTISQPLFAPSTKAPSFIEKDVKNCP